MPNPFSNRNMIRDPHQFFGRTRELNQIFSRLEPQQPQNVSVVGPHRMGRSSLLWHLYQTYATQLAQAGRYRVAYLDAMLARASLDTFRRRVQRALTDPQAVIDNMPTSQELHEQIDRTHNDDNLRDLCLALNVDYDNLGGQGKSAKARELVLLMVRTGRFAELSAQVRQRRANSNAALTSEEAFEDALAQLRERGLCPVLLLDEFESLTEHPEQFNDVFFDWLRAVLNQGLLTLVTTSALSLSEIRQRRGFVSTFFGLFTQVDLGELSAPEADALLRQPHDRSFDDQHVQLALDMAGTTHPLRLSMAADQIYQHYDTGDWATARTDYLLAKRLIWPEEPSSPSGEKSK